MREEFHRLHGMLPDSGMVLCAVSGGADSMCLLCWMIELSHQYGFTVAAAHFHHGLRPKTGDRDEAFVRDFCQKNHILFCAGRGDTAAAAKADGLSIEEAARKLRYTFLEKAAAELGAVRIATAHHRGDQAETVLLRLIRGTGLTGLTGIAPVRGIIIRPMLDTTKEEIETYLARRQIPHVEDETNASLQFTRNRLRHELLPLLRTFNPNIEEALSKTASILHEEDVYMKRQADALCDEAISEGNRASIRRKGLQALPAAMQRRALQRLLDCVGASKKEIGLRHIDAMRHIAMHSGPTAQLSLPQGLIAANEGVFFTLIKEWQGAWDTVVLAPVCQAETGPWRIRCFVTARAEEKENRIILNNEAIDAEVTVGRWQERARMTLGGQSGSRSLKRLFSDAGITPRQREYVPVVYVGGRVAAVLGVGVDAAFEQKEGGVDYVLDMEKRRVGS